MPADAGLIQQRATYPVVIRISKMSAGADPCYLQKHHCFVIRIIEYLLVQAISL